MAKEPKENNVELKRTSSPSFVKLAMKNMVRKGNQSIMHFTFTAVGLLFFLVALAWLGKPNLPAS